jgi:putative hydrolase of the HAD superfamily
MMKLAAKERWARLPDALFCDLDNTLYAYEPAHAAAMAAARSKADEALSMNPADFDKAFALARDAVQKNLAGTAPSHSRLLYFQRMLESIGLGSQALLALDLEQTYWRTFLSNAALFEGVEEFFDDIRLLGIPAVVVTDLTAQIQFRKIVYFGLDKYFDYIVTSEEAGFDKPHASPFALAVEKVSPQGNCFWMIGDNPERDIRGAREAINALTLQKLHDGVRLGEGLSAPDASFREFEELRTFVARVSAAQPDSSGAPQS